MECELNNFGSFHGAGNLEKAAFHAGFLVRHDTFLMAHSWRGKRCAVVKSALREKAWRKSARHGAFLMAHPGAPPCLSPARALRPRPWRGRRCDFATLCNLIKVLLKNSMNVVELWAKVGDGVKG
jgi:hypothetical protein